MLVRQSLGILGAKPPKRIWKITHYTSNGDTQIYYADEEPQVDINYGYLIAIVAEYPEFYKRWPKHKIIVSPPYLAEEVYDDEQQEGQGIIDGGNVIQTGVDN